MLKYFHVPLAPSISGEFAVGTSFLCREKHIFSKNNAIGAIVILVDVHVQSFAVP